MPQNKIKKERFQLLLEQVGLSDVTAYADYTNGTQIEKLIADKASKTWQFHLKTSQIFPQAFYQMLDTGMKRAFSEIAQTELKITATDAR